MAASQELLPPTTPERAVPAAPPLSSGPIHVSAPVSAPTPAPAPAPAPEPVSTSVPAPTLVTVETPVYVPPPTLAPPPVRAPEVQAHVHTAELSSEPLFTVQVWQLGFAVIVVMAVLLYALGLL